MVVYYCRPSACLPPALPAPGRLPGIYTNKKTPIYALYIYMYMFRYLSLSLYIYIYIYISLSLSISLSLYTYIYIHTYTHTYIHTCIHTYMHTYIHTTTVRQYGILRSGPSGEEDDMILYYDRLCYIILWHVIFYKLYTIYTYICIYAHIVTYDYTILCIRLLQYDMIGNHIIFYYMPLGRQGRRDGGHDDDGREE